jgi:hypothetical protein
MMSVNPTPQTRRTTGKENCVSQLVFDFPPRRPKKRFDFHRFLQRLERYAQAIVGTLIFLALLIDFTLKELHPIIVSIAHTLHGP